MFFSNASSLATRKKNEDAAGAATKFARKLVSPRYTSLQQVPVLIEATTSDQNGPLSANVAASTQPTLTSTIDSNGQRVSAFGPANIYINLNGAFFTGYGNNRLGLSFGQRQAVTILHELGHAYAFNGGLSQVLPDGGNNK